MRTPFLFSALSLALIINLFGCSSVAPKNDTSQLKYTYARLKIMDLDQMSDIALKHARDFKKEEDVKILQEGLLITLSRPDEDSVVEKIISLIRNPMEDRNLWESSVDELVDQSVAVIKDSSQSSVDQVTYSVVLENLISELRPEFVKQYKSPGFEARMIEKIAAAHVQLSAPANAERKLNLMKGSFSASQVAQKMLDKRDDFLKAENKKNKDEKPDAP